MKTIHGFSLKEIFDQAYLARMGVSFDQFEKAPVATLQAVGQGDAIDIMRAGHRPLMPAQVELRRTLETQWAREGVSIEPRLRRKVNVQRTNQPMVLAA